MTPWHEAPKARRILAGLTADDIVLTASYGLGPGCDHYEWSVPDHCDALNAIRRATVERGFGSTFTEANAVSRDRAREYLAADALQPSVDAVLAMRFGDASQFVPVPGILNRWQDSNPARARAHVAAVIGAVRKEAA